MDAFEHNLMLLVIGAVAGGVIWHFIHAKVAADIAALQSDVSTLKTQAASAFTALAAPAPVAAAAATPAKPAGT
jgi:hypothetical protein